MVIKANALFPEKDYIISLQVQDIVTKVSNSHSIDIFATTGDILEITIDSRHNKHGYIDYANDAIFVCTTTFNGSEIGVVNATYTWSISATWDDLDMSLVTQELNSILIPAYVLEPDENYRIKVDVSYEGYDGTTDIFYTTDFETMYKFEVQPASGIAYNTDFVMSVALQTEEFEISQFNFGYIVNRDRYLLTRSSPVRVQTVILPRGDPLNSNKLKVY